MWKETLRDLADQLSLSPERATELFDSVHALAARGADGGDASDAPTAQVPAAAPPAPPADGPRTLVDVRAQRPPEPVAAPFALPSRYTYAGPVGAGGMGEVHRIRDTALNRSMVLKVMHHSVSGDGSAVAHFIEEAQVTAQLGHPGIVSVHELGRLPDGRLYFTMEEIEGQTLGRLIKEIHASASPSSWELPEDERASFRRLIEVFQRTCEAMAYAHARGVLHRDLKPSNVMIGAFGQVLVVDWGLALVTGRVRPEQVAVFTPRLEGDGALTRLGVIAGTPAYMSPEQANGAPAIGPGSDVYALGGILYAILMARPPYSGSGAEDTWRQVVAGPPPIPVGTLPEGRPPGHTVPEALCAICRRAMEREPADRYEDAGALAADVSAWLAGARRRQEGLRRVADAEALRPLAAKLRSSATELRHQAADRLRALPAHAPIEHKRRAWEAEDRAIELAEQADRQDRDIVQFLREALSRAPDLAEAHASLARTFHDLHQRAEAEGRPVARWYEAMLQSHDRGEFADYLRGDGALTLVTDPPARRARVYRLEYSDRRLRPSLFREFGAEPIAGVRIPMGSYLVSLTTARGAEVTYPVHITRGHHWNGTHAGEGKPAPIPLGAGADTTTGEVYVPRGPFLAGGDRDALNSLPRQRVWVDGFVIQRHPVTNAAYLEFLNDLVARGERALAGECAPGLRANNESPFAYTRREDGSFGLPAHGELGERHPVVLIDHAAARAYARWLRRRTGSPWRLPGELEWEKAARGVDGRTFVWGDHLDATWCRIANSLPGGSAIATIDEHPEDVSPYGVRGMTGNSRDWCAGSYLFGGPAMAGGRYAPPEPDEVPEPAALVKGGAWFVAPDTARVASRFRGSPDIRSDGIGFRLVRSV